MIYMAGVAQDLRNQCIRLEASWAGMENVTTQKQEILTETEQEPTFDYGTSMKTAGQGGSKYTSYTVAAQELIQGCIDIVDEVCTQKIGRPNSGQTADDKNYIESPYALNSVVDFVDNIKSVKNAYEGIGYDGTNNATSVSAYIATIDPSTDTEVKALIDEAITKIQAIPEPFAKNATGAEADGVVVDVNSLVSMNMWGLTPDFLDVLKEGFKEFFEKEVPSNPLKAEYLIPIFIGELLEQGKMSVKVLKTNDTWYGMTYHEDVAAVKDSFKKMLENGVYKADLFCDL